LQLLPIVCGAFLSQTNGKESILNHLLYNSPAIDNRPQKSGCTLNFYFITPLFHFAYVFRFLLMEMSITAEAEMSPVEK
jgi:hypothetical protein